MAPRRSRRAFPNVRVVKRTFTTHAEQWNFGLEQTGIATEWVLALDADYVLTDDLVASSRRCSRSRRCRGFAASFDYCIDGRPLRGAAYPPVTVLYRRARGRYEQDGHTQRVRLDGEVRAAGRAAFSTTIASRSVTGSRRRPATWRSKPTSSVQRDRRLVGPGRSSCADGS